MRFRRLCSLLNLIAENVLFGQNPFALHSILCVYLLKKGNAHGQTLCERCIMQKVPLQTWLDLRVRLRGNATLQRRPCHSRTRTHIRERGILSGHLLNTNTQTKQKS